MSQPISQCFKMKASVDDEAYAQLLDVYKNNHINGGHWTEFGCGCTPPCHITYGVTEAVFKTFQIRFMKDWESFITTHDNSSCLVCNTKD